MASRGKTICLISAGAYPKHAYCCLGNISALDSRAGAQMAGDARGNPEARTVGTSGVRRVAGMAGQL